MVSFFIKTGLYSLVFLLIVPSNVKANVLGSDTQNFVPVVDGLDFVTVHSGKILDPGFWNLGLFVNYANNPLPSFGADTSEDSLTGLDFNFGVGLLERLELGISVPQIVHQSITDESNKGSFSATGVTEIRWTVKVKAFGDESGGLSLIYSQNHNLTSNNPFIGKDNTPIRNLEVAFSKNIGPWTGGVNLGYRWRQESDPINTETPIDPLKNQIISSIALSYYSSRIDTRFITETFASNMLGDETSVGDQSTDSLETLIGAKYMLSDNWALHAGYSHGWYRGLSSPDNRFYMGINFGGDSNFFKKKEKFKVEEKLEPSPKNPSVKITEEVFVTKNIEFDFDSTKITNKDADKIIEDVASYVKRNASVKTVVIVGHTDSLGDPVFNKQLSLDRANKVAEILKSKLGVRQLKIITEGKGDEDPVADNSNRQGRATNRRVEFRFVK